VSRTNSGGRPVFYCIAATAQAVVNDLMRIGFPSPDVRGVDRDGFEMQGIEGGTLREHHDAPGPTRDNIRDVVRAMGWVVLTLDDSAYRERMGGRR
jgi:hypothetical protein